MRTQKPTPPATQTPRARTASRRAGMRPIRIWIPDIDEATFRAEAHRQSLAVALSSSEPEDQAFIDDISDRPAHAPQIT
jgi:hypothetical protein